jgi:hypothetical protein
LVLDIGYYTPIIKVALGYIPHTWRIPLNFNYDSPSCGGSHAAVGVIELGQNPLPIGNGKQPPAGCIGLMGIDYSKLEEDDVLAIIRNLREVWIRSSLN